MSPLFSEPSSGSLLHFQEKKKKSKFLHWLAVPRMVCPWPPSWSSPPCSSDCVHFCLFLECAKPCICVRGCSGIFLSLGCPFPLYVLTLCSLLTNHLQISVFKIVPPPGHKNLYPDPSPLHILLTLFYFSF